MQGIEIIECDFDHQSGKMAKDFPYTFRDQATAVLVPSPNYFGVIEDVDAITNSAHAANLAVIAVVNPLAMTVLKAPGEWGTDAQKGAEISVGEGQPLGIPLSSGGPYFGFMTCKQTLVRQMPGRIIGQTTDSEGKIGYTLTLQTREQHIRRGKATSNICTNQGLMVTAATIHMAIMGGQGLYAQATQSHDRLMTLHKLIAAEKLPLTPRFSSDHFHECVLSLPEGITAQALIESSVAQQLLLGVSLRDDYPELGETLLVCTTEQRTLNDLTRWVETVSNLLPT